MPENKEPSGNVNKYIGKDGGFARPASAFRNWISSKADAEFPPEKGRYHLYVAYSCPWAHRALILRELRGLQDVFTFTAMHWHQDEKGWRFATKEEEDTSINMTPDPHHPEFSHLQDLYFKVQPDYEGRYTTPTLYDIKTGKIVSNESADIIRMMDSEFDGLLGDEGRHHTVYPASRRAEIDAANEWIYNDLNNGVYRAGFAQSQDAYDNAALDVFSALERAEAHLRRLSGAGPYFWGACITETDIRLFTTIVRFDPVYAQHFKLNLYAIRTGYPALHKWMRLLYWEEPSFKNTTKFDHIKFNYTKSQLHVNPTGITPLGPIPNILRMDEEAGGAPGPRMLSEEVKEQSKF